MKPYAVFSLLLLGIAALTLTSCGATKAYQQAQATFSQGITVERQVRFAVANRALPGNFVYFDDLYRTGSLPEEGVAAADYYATARDAIRKALRGKRSLRKIEVLDNAYALKALLFWRTGDYPAATAAAEKAIPLLEKASGEENDMRDLVIMRALPGLLNIDKSYPALSDLRTWGEELVALPTTEEKAVVYDKIKRTYLAAAASTDPAAYAVARGLSIIEGATQPLEGENAIQLCLLNSQLAGLDNWGGMLQVLFLSVRRLDRSIEEVSWVMNERNAYNVTVKTYLDKLVAILPKGKENKLYAYWALLLAGNI